MIGKFCMQSSAPKVTVYAATSKPVRSDFFGIEGKEERLIFIDNMGGIGYNTMKLVCVALTFFVFAKLISRRYPTDIFEKVCISVYEQTKRVGHDKNFRWRTRLWQRLLRKIF